MPKANPIYNSFNAGELSDLIRGRSDLDQYFRGGLSYKNMLALQYGPMCNRPGSMYSANVKTDAKITRLMEYVSKPSDAFAIEMGDLYFRFFTSAGPVGAPFEVVSTYLEAELFDIHYAQSNDTISIVHKDHKPAKLVRTSPTTFTLTDYLFAGNPYLDTNSDDTHFLTPSVSAKGATGTLTATGSGNTPFTADHIGSYWRVGAPTGSPEVQGYVEITAFTSTTVVSIEVVEALAGTAATVDWAEAAWSDEIGWPSRVAYFQNRLWFANTPTQPNGIWGSKPFVLDNFDPGTGLDDDAISELVPDASDIRWILGGRSLLVGTDKGDYSGATGDAAAGLTPEGVAFNRQTGWESEAIQPKIIGNYAYAVQGKGRKLREIFYFFNDDSYKSTDMNAVAEHITKSGVIEIAYQRNPYSMMYCVLDNGKMAVMTRESDQQVLAWTILDTDGLYESVISIPHPTEPHDMVFAIVKRTIDGTDERHVEFFESPIIPDRQEFCHYVDDGLTFNAYTSNVGGTLTLGAVTGLAITFTAGSAVFVSGDVGQRIRAIDSDGVILGEGKIVTFTSTTVVEVDIDKDFTTTSYAANVWGISVNTISGLDHLEAKIVKLLVDGGTNEDKTVASGSITLDTGNDGFIIAIGLGYTSRWQNMEIEAGAARGTAQGQKKRIYRADFKFFRSLGMKTGADENNLNTLILRDPATFMGQVEPLFTGTFAGVKLNTQCDYEGFMVVQQDNPLPLCVLAIVPHVETNEV